MKKIFVIFSMILCLPCLLFSRTITKEQAIVVAETFFKDKSIDINDNYNFDYLKHDGIVTVYVVSIKSGGWVLISSDSNAKPILGYSLTGTFATNKLNTSLTKWVSTYSNEIVKLKRRRSVGEVHPNWNMYLSGSVMHSKRTSVNVAPLIPANWNQNAGWNRFCPEASSGPGGKVYVGCVAVAGAQAMSVFKYPTVGFGEYRYNSTYGNLNVNYGATTYNWSRMSNTTSDNYNSLLLYHLAVGVNMNFGAGASGAFTKDLVRVLVQNFRYDNKSVKILDRKNFTDGKVWRYIIEKELKEGRPLIYAGNGSSGESGHAFNLDGADGSGFYHFNWGWSGAGNGYFSIDNVGNSAGEFNEGQRAIIGIMPQRLGPVDLTLSSYFAEEDRAVNNFVAKIFVDDFDNNVKSITVSGKTSIFKPNGECPFVVVNDSLFSTETLSQSVTSKYELTFVAIDEDNISFSKDITIQVSEVDIPVVLKNKIQPINLPINVIKVVSLKDVFYDLDGDKITITIENYETDYFSATISGKNMYVESFMEGSSEIVILAKTEQSFVKDTVVISVVSTTDILDNVKSRIFLYPNPVSDVLKIRGVTNFIYKIYDISGALLLQGREDEVNIQNLLSGLYIIEISKGNSKLNYKFIVK